MAPRTEEQKAKRREHVRKEREANKAFTGWQRTLGIGDARPTSRLCLRPARQPGVAPDCSDAREFAPRPITLPRLAFLER